MEVYKRGHAGALLLLALASLGCRNPVRGDPQACEQTYEFGNYGCAEVRGQVLGSHGLPLGGVLVVPIYLGDAGGYDFPSPRTNGEGRFSMRFHSYRPRMTSGDPNAVDLYVRAMVLPPPVVGAVSPARDSVLVNVKLSPIGTVPTPATVTIRLAYPQVP